MSQEISMELTFGGDHSQSAPSTRALESQQTADLGHLIMEEMENLPDVNQPCIFKTPQMLRELNPKAYTPYRVSIGPYHANNPQLKSMEPYKLRALRSLISRSQGSPYDTLKNYIKAIESREYEARRYYSNIEELDSENFRRILLLDGALIVELFYSCEVGADLWHLMEGNLSVLVEVCQDLLLLENQLPFFILEELFHWTFNNSSYTFPVIAYHTLIHLIPFVSNEDDGLSPEQIKKIVSQKQVMHLLDLIRKCCCFDEPTPQSPLEVVAGSNAKHMEAALDHQVDQGEKPEQGQQKFLRLLITLRGRWGRKKNNHKVDRGCNVISPHFLNRSSVTELHDVGIQFRAQKGQSKQPMHIKFDKAKGVVEMSHLSLEDYTEIFLRNVLAYEEYYLDDPHMTGYLCFMSGLINTKKDVDILERSRLIDSYLESNEEAATMFNTVTKHAVINVHEFKYKELCNELKAYAMKPRNRWRAMLRRDYFGSPWAVISFIAAVILLLLTALQTIATLRSTNWN